MSALDAARPRRAAVVVAASTWVLTAAAAVTTRALAPGLSSWGQRLVAVLVLAVAVTAVLVATRSWRVVGFVGPRRWAHLQLLWLPALHALVPSLWGLHSPGARLLAVLVVGYAATGFAEEALYRGVVLGLLRPVGVLPAVLLSSALFGCAHLTNTAFGASPVITAAQAVGTSCFGVGYAALRLRTGTLWPLVVLHVATDLVLRLSDLPAWAFWTSEVGGDTLLLLYGLHLLRGGRGGPTTPATSPRGQVVDRTSAAPR